MASAFINPSVTAGCNVALNGALTDLAFNCGLLSLATLSGGWESVLANQGLADAMCTAGCATSLANFYTTTNTPCGTQPIFNPTTGTLLMPVFGPGFASVTANQAHSTVSIVRTLACAQGSDGKTCTPKFVTDNAAKLGTFYNGTGYTKAVVAGQQELVCNACVKAQLTGLPALRTTLQAKGDTFDAYWTNAATLETQVAACTASKPSSAKLSVKRMGMLTLVAASAFAAAMMS
jgi:hypothetical protein